MANETAGPKPPTQPLGGDFETGLTELEKIVKDMESGNLPLERSMELFEQGMALTGKCRKQLQDAETRVEMIIRKEGQYQPEPFSPSK